jgi:hypothetical protein
MKRKLTIGVVGAGIGAGVVVVSGLVYAILCGE